MLRTPTANKLKNHRGTRSTSKQKMKMLIDPPWEIIPLSSKNHNNWTGQGRFPSRSYNLKKQMLTLSNSRLKVYLTSIKYSRITLDLFKTRKNQNRFKLQVIHLEFAHIKTDSQWVQLLANREEIELFKFKTQNP